MRYIVDQQGNYIGSFGGSLPEGEFIEVPFPPADARMIWDFDLAIWQECLAQTKLSKIAELENFYSVAQWVRVENGHIFNLPLRGEAYSAIRDQCLSAIANNAPTSLGWVDITGDYTVIENIPVAAWKSFYDQVNEPISKKNFFLREQKTFEINSKTTIEEVNAVVIDVFPAPTTIILDILDI